MPRSYTNYIDDPHWDSSRKIAYRQETILRVCRSIFDKSIPSDRQYWTMAGAHYTFDNDRVPIKADGEFGQLLKAGILQSNQFFGVDREAEVIANNQQFYPEANWLHGDFKDMMVTAAAEERFFPAVVNYDGVMGLKFGVPYLKKLLRFIDHNVPHDMIFLANFVMKQSYRKNVELTGKQVLDHLQSMYDFPDHWSLNTNYYRYHGGAGKSVSSVMGVFVFRKAPHEKIKITSGRCMDEVILGGEKRFK